jgi:hypothetical protein
MGYFLKPSGENLTGSFTPHPLSAKIRSMARSAKIGIHWVIRVNVEKIREEVWC